MCIGRAEEHQNKSCSSPQHLKPKQLNMTASQSSVEQSVDTTPQQQLPQAGNNFGLKQSQLLQIKALKRCKVYWTKGLKVHMK